MTLQIYQRWKWRVLLAFSGLYLFVYLGRLNYGLLLPIVMDDLELTHTEMGLIAATGFWAYGFGHMVHGRLSDLYSPRIYASSGGIISSIFNVITSFGYSVATLAIPWGINGFAQAMCWSPGMRMISQWWPKKERGKAAGIALAAAGLSTALVWVLTGWTAENFGWRWGFRLPLIPLFMASIAFWYFSRDRPSDVGLPEYIEEDEISINAEEVEEKESVGVRPYIYLLKQWKFVLACQIIGFVFIARYALLTWVPLYYTEAAGFNIREVVLNTLALPLGMVFGPMTAGLLSDRLFKARRFPVIGFFNIIAAFMLIGIAMNPIANLYAGALLLFSSGFFIFGAVGVLQSLAMDMGGRKFAGTATGLLNWHSYMYAGFQSALIGVMLDAGEGWQFIFILLGLILFLSAILIYLLKLVTQ